MSATRPPADADAMGRAPVRLTPARSPRPWGGGRFGAVDGVPVGELWVSGDEARLPDGQTLGETGLATRLPLVKLLDVAGTLSVQVHPDEATARALHGAGAVGKHECWVVLEAPPGASVALGLADGASVDDLFSNDERRIVAALRACPVQHGTVLDIPPGTVHAPAGGLVLYEVQQRSDLTYRIWDWGRPRPLHLAESRRAIRPDSAPRVASLPLGPGPDIVSDPAAPFRLEHCHPGDGVESEIASVHGAVLSVIGGTLRSRLHGAAGSGAADDGPETTMEEGSHWLLPPGRWTLGGAGEALIAMARPRT